MPHLKLPMPTITALAIACAATFAAPAWADSFVREEIAMSAETCQAALPAFDGSIRKRPMALMNEGSGNSFVTCAFSGVNDVTPFTISLEIHVVNLDVTHRTVTCTLVDGRAGFNNPLYVPRALSVAPGGQLQNISWTIGDSAETQVAGFVYPALSCVLPPKTGISFTSRLYHENQ